MLCELETDKVSVEVPAPAAGVSPKSSPPKAQQLMPVQARHHLAALDGRAAPPLQHQRRCTAPSAKDRRRRALRQESHGRSGRFDAMLVTAPAAMDA